MQCMPGPEPFIAVLIPVRPVIEEIDDDQSGNTLCDDPVAPWEQGNGKPAVDPISQSPTKGGSKISETDDFGGIFANGFACRVWFPHGDVRGPAIFRPPQEHDSGRVQNRRS